MRRGATEKVVADLKVLFGDIEELVKTTAGQPGALVPDLRERLETKIADAKRALAEREQAVRDKAMQARARTESYLCTNIWSTIAMVAGVSFLFGLLQRRDRRRVGAAPIQRT